MAFSARSHIAVVSHAVLREEVSKGVLARMGLDTTTIIIALSSLAFVILLMFAFIFLGIMSMTTGSGFGAVVNSILPVLAGGGAASGEDPMKKLKEAGEKIEKTVMRVVNSFMPTD